MCDPDIEVHQGFPPANLTERPDSQPRSSSILIVCQLLTLK